MSTFDEVNGPKGVRAHYQKLMDRLDSLGEEDLADRFGLIDSIFRTLGITFAVPGHEQGLERTWPMDLVPRIIPPDEWQHIESGLIQRVTVLNRFLDDLYVGGQEAINDGIIPRWLVESADGYVREAHGIPAPGGSRCGEVSRPVLPSGALLSVRNAVRAPGSLPPDPPGAIVYPVILAMCITPFPACRSPKTRR